MLLALFNRRGNGPRVAKCRQVPESGSSQTHPATDSAFLGGVQAALGPFPYNF